jgi:hypothetical protein
MLMTVLFYRNATAGLQYFKRLKNISVSLSKINADSAFESYALLYVNIFWLQFVPFDPYVDGQAYHNRKYDSMVMM